MASIIPYPSGSDIIAPLPLYTPDFSAINSMMQRRAAMFEQGLSQVKSSDSLIRNAALSVSDNQVVRDQYIKQAEDQLKKLQGADFSQMQNVDAAQQVYAPFWQDRELLEDYSKTQAISAERARAESMAQSSDPKVREQYWKTGLDYINLAANDLSLAKRGDGSISRVKVNKYVPFFDAMGELQKRAKDQGLQIEIESQEGPNKEYKITRINGDGAVPLFKEWAAEQLASMPQAEEVFRVEGTVQYRQQVQNLQAQGYEEGAAKQALAEQYMTRQKEHYEQRHGDLSEMVTELTKKLDTMDVELKAKYDAGTMTIEEKAARKELARQLEVYKGSASTMQQNIDRYSKPDSKEYQDEYASILNGGEDFFRRSRKNDMINNFARSYAINSKLKIDIDPVYKLNLEIQKDMLKLQQDDNQFAIRYGDGTSGSGTSSRGKSSKADEANPLDTPVYVGRTISGNDPIEAQQRMKEYYNRVADEYLQTGASIINEAGMLDPSKMVSPAYQKYLVDALKTGKVADTPELKAEHKRLQDLKVIPASYKLGDSPSQIYNLLYDRATDLLAGGARAGSVNANVFNRIQTHARQAQNYIKLRDLNNEVEKKIASDPMFKGLMKDGKLMTLDDYMKHHTGYSSEAAYMKKMAYAPMSDIEAVINANTMGNYSNNKRTTAQDRWDDLKEQYTKAYGLVKSKTAVLMQRYMGVEGAVIGQDIELSTDRKEDREQAQVIAQQAASSANMANQIVDKDGAGYPVNIAQLEQLGANRDKIKELLDLTRGNIDNFIDKVRLTKVGINGKPTVKLIYNIDEVKKLLGEKNFNNEEWQKTIRVLNNGLELAVDQAQIAGFAQDFELPGASDVGFDSSGMVKAPAAIKKFGFDYTILKDPASRQYIINFQYQDNGTARSKTLYAPLEKSLTSVQTMLEQNMYAMYTGNQQALQKKGQSGNFISRTEDYNTMINK